MSSLPHAECPAHSPDAPGETDGSDGSSQPGEVDLGEALEFLDQFHQENPVGDRRARSEQVRLSIRATGTYHHTAAELTWGARVAWRNNARCIGRLYWNSLHVRDLRNVRAGSEVAEHCWRHLRLAGNRGRIRPVISVFAPDAPGWPGPRIWNEQLIRYAGYHQPDGSVLGDPRYLGFAERVRALGWMPPDVPGRFDVLPVVVETAEDGPQLFTPPAEDVLEVPLSHPDLEWFAELGLRWHAVPAISNMQLGIGGISYPAAPFNGWYMGTEIGARNLVDPDRYDQTGAVARGLGLDMSSEQTLWRDRAVIEINRAVLHSFNQAGVSITDHHTESRRFLTHVAREENSGRVCPADWSWIVPPISGALTPVFHQYYDGEVSGPRFIAHPAADDAAPSGCPVAHTPLDQPAASTELRRDRLGWFKRK